MYIKDDKIYADAGETLVGGQGNSSIDSLVSSLENGISFEKMRVYKMNPQDIFMFNFGFTCLLPTDRSFESIYKMFVQLGYSEDAQLKILMDKDKSEVDNTNYENMLVWMDFADKAAKLVCPFLSIEISETLETVRNETLKEIEKYDESAEVNSFFYNGLQLWLDKATRVGLMNSTAILQNAGEENTTLWLGDINVTLPCATVILMLSKIEMYALECYNITAQHKSAVNAMTEIADIKAFDYRSGYPEKLSF